MSFVLLWLKIGVVGFVTLKKELAAAYRLLEVGDEHAHELLKYCIYVNLEIEIGISLNSVNINN